MHNQDLYERKIISNKEFPVALHINDVRQRLWYFDAHWHEHIELHYILEGYTLIKLGQKEIHAQKGDLVVANANELHAGYCDGRPFKALVVIFELESFSKELADWNIVLESLIQGDSEVVEIMDSIYREFRREDLGYTLCIKGALLRLIAYLVRNYTAAVLTETESDKRKKRLERLNTVIEYIGENYTEPISNGELAELIHLSEDRFNHLFKESMGMSPLQYMNELRLKKAKNLLKRREDSVAEVAAAVGFTDYNHFGRMFRRYYGCAPTDIWHREAVPKKEKK